LPRYRICYQKTGPAAWLSHLDLVRVMERAVRRAGLPLAYSAGFNPQPRLMFASPLPVGISGEQELADMELEEARDPAAVMDGLNRYLPQGLAVRGARLVENGGKLPAQDRTSFYRLAGRLDGPWTGKEMEPVIERFLMRETIPVTRRVKGKTRTDNIRPGIISLTGECRGETVEFYLTAAIGVRPRDVVAALVEAGLPADPDAFDPVRLGIGGCGPLY